MKEKPTSPGPSPVRIVEFHSGDEDLVEQAAVLLTEGFKTMAPDSWTSIEEARKELDECLEEGRICLAGLDKNGRLLGWIGGRYSYARVWELHPLVVHPAQQLRGIGQALVFELERRVAERGCLTLMLGTDDQTNQTSLSGMDLYPDVWQHMRTIRNLTRHPYEFYMKCGYSLIGVVPDANGWGKPDIMMSKRVGPITGE
jgi:aminoglycoside 6'-N-acetyltransferase I